MREPRPHVLLFHLCLTDERCPNNNYKSVFQGGGNKKTRNPETEQIKAEMTGEITNLRTELESEKKKRCDVEKELKLQV